MGRSSFPLSGGTSEDKDRKENVQGRQIKNFDGSPHHGTSEDEDVQGEDQDGKDVDVLRRPDLNSKLFIRNHDDFKNKK